MSNAPLYLVIDQGTSSTKSFLFDETGNIIHTEIIKHKLQYLVPFHVECDPKTILNACKKLIAESIIFAGRNSITKVGIAVQRSTFLFWEKKSAEPVTQALSWQDSRAQNIVNELSNHSDWIWEQTGAPLSPHFGGPKFLHMIRMNPDLRKKISSAQILYGPLSAYLTHALTGTATVDESIAGRTLFFNIHSSTWSKKCLDLFQIPESGLPLLKPVLNNYGLICDTNLSLQCVIGDQQAALIGQAGLTRGCIATNFGTSASVLYNAGENPIVVDGLISSVLLSDGTQRKYLVEGTINACNSLFYHLEKELKLPHSFMKWHELCSNQSTNGIYIPGFAGLAAPYWKSGFNDIYRNLDQKNKNEIIRAGMESIGSLVKNILDHPINKLNNISMLLNISLAPNVKNYNQKFFSISHSLKPNLLSNKIKTTMKISRDVFNDMNKSYSSMFLQKKNRLDITTSLINAMSHKNVLKRGYAIVRNKYKSMECCLSLAR